MSIRKSQFGVKHKKLCYLGQRTWPNWCSRGCLLPFSPGHQFPEAAKQDRMAAFLSSCMYLGYCVQILKGNYSLHWISLASNSTSTSTLTSVHLEINPGTNNSFLEESTFLMAQSCHQSISGTYKYRRHWCKVPVCVTSLAQALEE